MIRLVHNQTVAGSILIDDIDDGLPNKTVHRIGTTPQWQATIRDGYAQAPKQPVYLPRTSVAYPGYPGFIDLRETERVSLSFLSGKISKLQKSGLITAVSYLAGTLVPPVITSFDPSSGDYMDFSGQGLQSVAPFTTYLNVIGAGGPLRFSYADIVAAGGTIFYDNDAYQWGLSLPISLVPGVVPGQTTFTIEANTLTSNVQAL